MRASTPSTLPSSRSIVVATWFGCPTGFVATTYSLASRILAIGAALVFEGPATTIVDAIAQVPTPPAATIGFVVTIVVLRPEFTRIGIGVINAGGYSRMFTQLFVMP